MPNSKTKGNRNAVSDVSIDDDIGRADDVTATLLQLVVKVTDVISSNADFQRTIFELKNEIKDLKECNRGLTERIVELENRSEEWSSVSTSPKHATASPNDVMALTSAVSDEISERKDKEMNLVIQGLPEQEEGEGVTNAEAESKCLQNVCSLLESIEVPNPSISKAFRMGKRQSGRPRTVKVICSTQETRQKALSNAKRLKNLPEGHVNKKVFIRPDLTKLQRDIDFRRRQESRNGAGLASSSTGSQI